MEVSCKELRHRGWLLLGKNNFWQNFGVSAIAGVIGGWAGFLGYGPAEVGKDGYFVELQRGNDPTFASMFDGFKRYGVTMAAGLLQMLFSALWGMLFIIPGIVYSCGRAITFYVMHDNPELSPMEALDRSRELMQGYRGKYFRLGVARSVHVRHWRVLPRCVRRRNRGGVLRRNPKRKRFGTQSRIPIGGRSFPNGSYRRRIEFRGSCKRNFCGDCEQIRIIACQMRNNIVKFHRKNAKEIWRGLPKQNKEYLL